MRRGQKVGGRGGDESNIQYSIIEMTQLQVAEPSANSVHVHRKWSVQVGDPFRPMRLTAT